MTKRTLQVQSRATQDLAEFAVATSLSDINEVTRDAASRVVMDTVGVMLAGVTSDLAPPLLKILDGAARPGAPNVAGLGVCAPPEIAAMINGAFGHALDYDDVIEFYPGHPSSVVIGALLAAASPAELAGVALLESYVVGVETGARIGQALGDGHYARGFHATSTVGIFAAVIALTKLHRLGERETRHALGIAGSFASGLRCNFGTMTKALHSGWAARNATIAVELASMGFTANEAVFDAARGFFATYGDEHSDATLISGSFGHPYVFESPGVGLKRYPCYNGVHRAIDATRQIVAAHDVDWAAVDDVTCLMPPGRLKAVLYHNPMTGLEGKFSYEYVVAATLLDGSVGIDSFSNAAVQRDEIQQLMRRITLREDPQCAGADDEGRTKTMGTGGFMRVIVRMSGEEYSADVAHAQGSPSRPLSWDEVTEKFIDCAESVGIDENGTTATVAMLRALSDAPDVRGVICGLRAKIDRAAEP